MKKVIVLDTSIFCVWLNIPGFTSCGRDDDSWDYNRIDGKITGEIEASATLVLPLATIIETGNHISQSTGDRFTVAEAFCDILKKSVDNEFPWAAFSEQGDLWTDDSIRALASNWPNLAASSVSLGDATIKDVAEFYAKAGFAVEILTGDSGLKAYEPLAPPIIPRRRNR